MIIPDEINEDLIAILGVPNFHAGQISRVMRETGTPIEPKSEVEQAYVIHRLLLIYAEHGKDWRKESSRWLDELVEKAKVGRLNQGK